MKKETKENSKVIFIGEDRICQQVAYVLAIEDYEIKNFDFLKNLTEDNKEKCRDYEFYVCEFKRKVRKRTKTSVSNKIYKIQYLDDICREIDRECLVNHRGYRKELRQQSLYFQVKGFRAIHAAKKLNYNKVKVDAIWALRYLNPSELFLYVINAPVNSQLSCSLLESNMHLDAFGRVLGCCNVEVPFGNLLNDGSLQEIYQSTFARIVKLSSLNHSYCFCNTSAWCPFYNKENRNKPTGLKKMELTKAPETINVAIDRTCNLCCKSCRNEFYTMNETERNNINIFLDKILASGYLEKSAELTVAGQGEVFYSPYYRTLINGNIKRNFIRIFSNGTLFNKENWNLIKDKYETIDLIISIDAATKETYKKLRCGNFDVLLNNLRMISELHRQHKIRNWSLNYVVQRDNYREMIAFVELGRSLGVDKVSFLKMSNWGNLTRKEYLQKCMVINESYLDYDLWKVLQDPIFQDPIVDLCGLTRYIVSSDLRYMK